MQEQEQQQRQFRGIPDRARITLTDKRAKQGVNLTAQAKRAREQMQAKYRAENPTIFERARIEARRKADDAAQQD